MRAKSLAGLLKKGDRVAVSNVTGREASKVSVVSQRYCGNIVAGWALGKAGQCLAVPGGEDIPVFGQFQDLMKKLPEARRPNKIVVYSPPDAVYGDAKEVFEHGGGTVETLYVVTEHVSVEVTAKLKRLAQNVSMDIVGCNTLGLINGHDRTRVGAVGGESPDETFVKGSVCIISNSGNMVNTIATYLKAAGLGISYGISTGKDALILTPLKDLLQLAERDKRTSIIVLYVEPGGAYEDEALQLARGKGFKKPLLVYVAGQFAEGREISLGHAGAVVDGAATSATGKMALFDDYLGVMPFRVRDEKVCRKALAIHRRGLRVMTLHDLVPAATCALRALGITRDFTPGDPLTLRPWLVNLGPLGRNLPQELVPHVGHVAEPYGSLIRKYVTSSLGRVPSRQSMRNASHASSNDGKTPRVHGHSLLTLMRERTFGRAVLLYWLGHTPVHDFETQLFEMVLTAALTNGPGTISAQGAKLSASAGNDPNTAMITTLGCIGSVHGGNGRKAAAMLIDVFRNTAMTRPYDTADAPDLDALVRASVKTFMARKLAAKEAGIDYERIPCLGHPVFNTEKMNYDPREREVNAFLAERRLYNVFLDFYHRLSRALMDCGATSKVHAVNVDAAIACVLMGICWPLLTEKKITVERALDLPFLTFALGRVAGGAGEYLDHRECGTAMDMRVPVSECRFLGRERD